MKYISFKLNKKEKIVLAILILLTIKLFSSPLLINTGNYLYSKNHYTFAEIIYKMSWPAIAQQDTYFYNIGQAKYADKEYLNSGKFYLNSIEKTSELSCSARIQYVNSDLRQIEPQLDEGRALEFEDRILNNIQILKQCIEIDAQNTKAAINIAILESILETSNKIQNVQQPSDEEESTVQEQDAIEQDLRRQVEQREFNDQDTKQPTYDFSGPNW